MYHSRSAAQLIGKLSNRLRRRIDRLSSGGPFSGAQGRALHFLLAQDEEVCQRDVEEALGLRPPTATELLKRMEAGGLICREPSPRDGRRKRILVSQKAQNCRSLVMEGLGGLEEELTRGLTEEELESFLRTAEKMLANLGE